MPQNNNNIFTQYWAEEIFIDRYNDGPENAVDVLIPVAHTNELWKKNLLSIYREIPVKRLLIGNCGCTEQALEIVREFPRTVILDHQNFHSLGFSIRKLIEAVETEWFVYLHSDVFLPQGWFHAMVSHQSEFDWFECNRRKLVLLDYEDGRQNSQKRPFSGSQMGKKTIFQNFLNSIDDDYLYRNEDFVIRKLVEYAGGRYGRVPETFHYHQLMNKSGEFEPDFVRAEFTRRDDTVWMKKTSDMQVRGLIKYTQPDNDYIQSELCASLKVLMDCGGFDPKEFIAWTTQTNVNWLPIVKKVIWPNRFSLVSNELLSIGKSSIRIVRILIKGGA